MKFRTRLILAAAYLLLVVVLALEIPLWINISKRAHHELEAQLVANASVVAARINDDIFKTDPEAKAFVTGVVRQAAAATGTRIVAVDEQGAVFDDSSGEAVAGEVYRTPDRPEFARVFVTGNIDVRTRHSDTLGQDLLLVTAPVVHDREVIGAVRMSQTLGAVNAKVRRSLIGLAAIGAAVILVGLALAWLLSLALSRPIRRLADTATMLGEGDLGARAEAKGKGELASLGRNFNRMAAALGANIQAQRDFLANASHQLRTPLTGLRLRLEAIEGEGGHAAAEASKAQLDVARLAQLVEDLLKLARATSAEATGGRVDVSEAARQAVDRWSGPASKRGKQLVERIGGPSVIWANPDDLANVLDNLLENSIRYVPEGGQITIETGQSNGQVLLAVADTGPGVDPDDRTRVFERFYRGSAGKKAGPGTGLGLAVVDELVNRWGGKIRVAEGEGTRFEATFPAAPTVP